MGGVRPIVQTEPRTRSKICLVGDATDQRTETWTETRVEQSTMLCVRGRSHFSG